MKKIRAILLVIALLCCFIYNKNKANIDLYRANNYLKKNNVQKAQLYFEQAFSNGITDSKQREIYFNSIISSPITADSQEKLVKLIELSPNDYVSLNAEYLLYDLKTEIHRKYSQNYIERSVYNQQILHWNTMPIKYGYKNTDNIPKYFLTEIDNAFQEWEKSTQDKIQFKHDDNSPNIIISFNNNNEIIEENKKYIVAYTTPEIIGSELKKMTIFFNLKNYENKYFSENQIYNTALHEIGHALGFMGHSYNKKNVMYYLKNTDDKENKIDLTTADMQTMQLLYDIKPDISNTTNSQSKYIPYVVLGDDDFINKTKLKEADNYIKNAPNLPNGYIDIAEIYFAKQDYKNAVTYLKKGLKLATNDDIKSLIYYNLAVANLQLGNTKSAKDYITASKTDTDEVHYLLAEIYTKEKNWQNAINEYNYLIEKDSKNPEYTIGLTNTYIKNKKFIKARQTLKKHFDKYPSDKTNPKFKEYGIIKLFL